MKGYLIQLINEQLQENLLSEHLQYHIKENKPLCESVFRYNSESWINLINEVKSLYKKGLIELTHEDDIDFINTDAGSYDIYENEVVPLDIPMVMEDVLNEENNENKPLNKPKRNTGSGKKYMVYVKDPKSGNVRKITFGDAKGGLTAKINDPEARKAFSARHNCPAKKDKLTPGYWACRLPRYAKSLGLAGTFKGYW